MNEKLYIYEALELRNTYDALIRNNKSLLSSNITEMRKGQATITPVPSFDRNAIKDTISKLETRRSLLNREIQIANLNTMIPFRNANISLGEALEIKKKMNMEIASALNEAEESAYSIIFHKEERDINHVPETDFKTAMDRVNVLQWELHNLSTELHKANHVTQINFHMDPL